MGLIVQRLQSHKTTAVSQNEVCALRRQVIVGPLRPTPIVVGAFVRIPEGIGHFIAR